MPKRRELVILGLPASPERVSRRTAGGSHLGNVTSIVPRSSRIPALPILDAAPPILTQAKSLLGAVSSYLGSSTCGKKRRHSSLGNDNCCLCHASKDDRKAIETMEELKGFVRNEVAEMLRPVCNGISTLKTGLQNSWRQPQALQMVSGDVIIPKEDGIPVHSNNDHTRQLRLLPTRGVKMEADAQVTEVVGKDAGNPRFRGPNGAQIDFYCKALTEKTKENDALHSTVHELVSYQQKLTTDLETVQRQLCRVVQGRGSSFPDGRPTLYLDLLESTLNATLVSLDSFRSCFIVYSEARLHVPANKIWKPNFRNVYLASEAHWIYGLKAFFCEKMFIGFENESFMTDAASIYLDPAKLRRESYAYFKRVNGKESSAAILSDDAHFRTFCEQKFDSILPDAILLQPGDFDVEDMDNSFPSTEEINLSRSFTAAAMRVWLLHKLCLSFEPAATIFRARRGHEVDWNYMDSVVNLEDDKKFVPKVGFMIAPGFRLRESTLKSQIYPAARASISQVGIHGLQPGCNKHTLQVRRSVI